jgi:hypothetical protein
MLYILTLNTPSWRSAQLKAQEQFYLYTLLVIWSTKKGVNYKEYFILKPENTGYFFKLVKNLKMSKHK